MDDDFLEDGPLDGPNSTRHHDPSLLLGVRRACSELRWLAALAPSDWQAIDPKTCFYYATLLARTMHAMPTEIPFSLKKEAAIDAEASAACQNIEIRIYTPWARRFISRDFNYLQSKLIRYGASARVDAYLNEFYVRAAVVADAYPIDEKLISFLPCHTASIRVVGEQAGALLKRVCDLDRHFASQKTKGKKSDGDWIGHSQSMVTEPLSWIKVLPVVNMTSRFPIHVCHKYVAAREVPQENQDALHPD